MIVPSRRLLIAAGFTLLPAGALTTALPSVALLPGLLVLLVLVLALADAGRSRRAVGDLAVELPPVVRLTVDREGELPLVLDNPSQRARRVRLALPLPDEFEVPRSILLMELPAGVERSGLGFRCRPRRRGSYTINRCQVEVPSPLGLWAVRATLSLDSEVRVYPNLAPERKQLAALFLNRGGFGVHTQRQVGSGREFEKLREYVPGDSYEDIHWKATARRGHPITKVRQIERTQEVYVVIDASRLSTRAPANGDGESTTILERFVNAALVLGLAAERQGDLFGLAAFTDRMVRVVRAKGGKAHYGTCRDALYTLHAQDVTPDYSELFATLATRLRRRALLVFLCNLDDPALAKGFVRNVEAVCRRHLVLANMMRPPGAHCLFSDRDVSSVDDIYRHLAGHLQFSDLQSLGKVLSSRGVGFSLLDNEKLCSEVVSQYLTVKRRQLL